MRTVVVTGGGRGLGLAITQKLLDLDYRVVALSRSMSDELAEIAETQTRLTFKPFDLADVDGIDGLTREIIKETAENGRPTIHGLVNNAALGTDGVLGTMHQSDIEKLIAVNITAPILMAKYLSRAMMVSGTAGRIINIGSIIGSTGYSGLSVYGASKAAMEGFTRSLAREIGKRGITVVTLAPGYMETDMTTALSESGRLDSIRRRSALNRFARIEDVAAMCGFLMGEGGANVTGTTITVDAGSTA